MVNDVPQNPNFLSPANFTFSLAKLPVFSYLVTKVSLPSAMLQAIKSPTPHRALRVPGTALDFGQITVEYKHDEDLEAYTTLMNWMKGLGIPDNFDTYKELNAQPISNSKYSDATLTLLSSQKNSRTIIALTDAFPVSLGGTTMDSTITDINYVTGTVSFEFQSFNIQKP